MSTRRDSWALARYHIVTVLLAVAFMAAMSLQDCGALWLPAEEATNAQ